MDLTQNLYAKKIVFTKVKDKNAMENIAHTNLYDFNNGDDMFQLTKKEKESYLQTFSSFSSIYEMTFEYYIYRNKLFLSNVIICL